MKEAKNKMILLSKIFCTNIKHDNYLQLIQITIKTRLIKNAKFDWLGLESWYY